MVIENGLFTELQNNKIDKTYPKEINSGGTIIIIETEDSVLMLRYARAVTGAALYQSY